MDANFPLLKVLTLDYLEEVGTGMIKKAAEYSKRNGNVAQKNLILQSSKTYTSEAQEKLAEIRGTERRYDPFNSRTKR